ncbi:MAG: hypothetical protein QOE05_789 [Actinomycetota bacterium]|jgi:hypothetical protein|nr:hypothetical protein [Actinomycetota bacterium]
MTLDPEGVKAGFVQAGVPRVLADELMEAFLEAKRRFYLGDLRPNAVEGGRFAEAAFRILQWASDPAQKYTVIGKTLPRVDNLLTSLINGTAPESIRMHIPRALQVIYTIRNTRDAAHLADGIDPNLQDASLVVHVMDWTLAEFVRLFHVVDADEAQRTIEALVARDVPAIQTVRGVPRVLKSLRAGDHCLVLLYNGGSAGVGYEELRAWVRPAMRANLRRTLDNLVADDLVHRDGNTYVILRPGERYVEQQGLIEPL